MVASIGGKWLAFTGPLSVSGCAQDADGVLVPVSVVSLLPEPDRMQGNRSRSGIKGENPLNRNCEERIKR